MLNYITLYTHQPVLDSWNIVSVLSNRRRHRYGFFFFGEFEKEKKIYIYIWKKPLKPPYVTRRSRRTGDMHSG